MCECAEMGIITLSFCVVSIKRLVFR